MIEESLPEIFKQVQIKKNVAMDKLKQLGENLSSISMKRQYFQQRINNCIRFLKETIEGRDNTIRDDEDYFWAASLQKLFANFAESILLLKLNNICSINIGADVLVMVQSLKELSKI
jgi:hypothetical protein